MESFNDDQLFILLLVAVAAFFLGRASGGGLSSEARAEKRMRARQAAEQLFATLSPEVQQKVDELIQGGKIIEAIRLVREHTGAGLKESKQAVDARRASMGGA